MFAVCKLGGEAWKNCHVTVTVTHSQCDRQGSRTRVPSNILHSYTALLYWTQLHKTRRGSPIDNRPFTDKLHNVVQKERKKEKCDVKCDT